MSPPQCALFRLPPGDCLLARLSMDLTPGQLPLHSSSAWMDEEPGRRMIFPRKHKAAQAEIAIEITERHCGDRMTPAQLISGRRLPSPSILTRRGKTWGWRG